MNNNIKSATEINYIKAVESKRYDYLDNIKWVLAVLVILHHSAAIAGLDPFPINLPHVIQSGQYQYDILGNFQSINQGFFMSLFFFISAYFVIPSFNKKGASLFLKDKLKRLGIPILLTIFLIDPFALYTCDKYSFFQSFNNTFQMYASMLKSFNMMMGVTWFCWTLLVFNTIYVVIHTYNSSKNKTPCSPKKIPSALTILLFAIIMIPFNYLGLYLMKFLGEDFLGFHLLIFFPMYIVMFYFGIQAYKNKWLDQITFKHAFIWIFIWLVTSIFLKPIDGMISRPFTVIGMSIFLLYSFKTIFNSKNKWTQNLSRSAYAAYVIQVIPLCFIGKIYLPYMAQLPILNFLIIGIPSVIVSFILAHFMGKLPLLRKIF